MWQHIPSDTDNIRQNYKFKEQDGTSILVSYEPGKGMAVIHLHTPDHAIYKSIICRGTIISETNVHENKSQDLEPILKKYAKILSALPNNDILNTINGNYGILSSLTGSYLSPSDFQESLLLHLQQNIYKIITFPTRSLKYLTSLVQVFFTQKIQRYDITDLITNICIFFGFYRINFDFMQAGVLSIVSTLLTAYYDIFYRRKIPYIPKLMLLCTLNIVSIHLALVFQ